MNKDLIERAAEAYLSTEQGSAAARLRFLRGIWEIQVSLSMREMPYAPPEAIAARDAILAGRPLFEISPPSVPVAVYSGGVEEIARYVADNAGLPAEHAQALRAARLAEAVDEAALAAVRSPASVVSHMAASVPADADGALTAETVAFVLSSALSPLLVPAARAAFAALGEFDRDAWSSGRCPVCGADASVGLMGESTKLQGAQRTLWCGSCHTEWGYDRLRCVRCGTRNPESLRYRHIEEDPAHRVHLCEECHGYTRFVFADDLDKPFSIEVENAVMATLDAVARAEGYTTHGDGGSRSC